MTTPLVSCLMPTGGRPELVPSAIRCFLAQTHPRRELIIGDDGHEPIEHLVPADPRIRYLRFSPHETLGTKRNHLCRAAQGELLAHWDDDDWYAPERLAVQVDALADPRVVLCGIDRLLYLDLRTRRAWRYARPRGGRVWVSMLCYRRSHWERSPFPDVQVASDTQFVWRTDARKIAILAREDLNICTIHEKNVSPKRLASPEWREIPAEPLWARWDARDTVAQPIVAGPAAWTVLIPTCERPHLLRGLLADVERERQRGTSLTVHVWDDASTADYQSLATELRARGDRYTRLAERHGRPRHWALWNQMLASVERAGPGHMLALLPDDVRLTDRFFDEASAIWRSLDDPRKLTLTLGTDDLAPAARWTGRAPALHGAAWKTQWVDGAFVAPAALVDALGGAIDAVPSDRWQRDPSLSSGVGRALSLSLDARGWGLYRTRTPLLHAEPTPSLLHPPASLPPRATAAARWVVVVMSYDRPSRLRALIEDLAAEARRGVALEVRVYDDHSPSSLADVEAELARHGWRLVRATHRHGKRGYAQWVSQAYRDLAGALGPDTLLAFLQDDVRLGSRFFERAEQAWAAIDDPHKRALTVLVDGDREHAPVWTRVRPVRVGAAWKTQWVDQLFVTDRRFLETLDHAVPPIPPTRWDRDPTLSSGVGWALSTTLVSAGFSLYRTHESLIAHGLGPSRMNPEARARVPLTTVRFVDGPDVLARLQRELSVTAALASIPARRAALEVVVRRLIPQCQRVCVYLNGYDDVPAFLEHPQVVVARSQDHGDRGDAGKFFWAPSADHAYFTCDDDLHYPIHYVDQTLAALERQGRTGVVGYHGIWVDRVLRSYYRERRVSHFAHAQATDLPVHLLGTGCAAWFGPSFRVAHDDFRAPNMGDVWLGRLARAQGLPMTCLARPRGWLRSQDVGPGIFEAHARSDALQTQLIRELAPWKTMRLPSERAGDRRAEPRATDHRERVEG